MRVSAALTLGPDRDGRPRRAWGPADALTALRLPLAVVFVAVPDAQVRLAVLLAAGGSDVLDGIVARRLGPSRIGAVLDPVVDKVFMLAAVLSVVTTHGALFLRGWEIAGLLLRDLAVTGAVLVVLLRRRRRVTLPARLSGKSVSVLQFVAVAAILLESPYTRPCAWAVAAASLWAIADYARIGVRVLREGAHGAHGA